MNKFGIKIIAKNKYNIGFGCNAVNTKRGWEKWLSIDSLVGYSANDPPMLFNSLNEAFKYIEKRLSHNLEDWYWVVEEYI